MDKPTQFNRSDFLRLSALTLGGLAIEPLSHVHHQSMFPQHDRLGRVNTGKIDVKAAPNYDSPTLGVLYEDAVIPWLREVVGAHPYRIVQRWVETTDGYVWSPNLQPVLNQPNLPVEAFPPNSQGEGMWVEVTIPYVDLILANPPARSPWLQNSTYPRLYYSQILWVDSIDADDFGQVWYRINERYGSYGDIFWAQAEAFRPLTVEDLSPIHPDVEDKHVEIDVTYQTLSCYEGNDEVYFCRISTGAKFDAYGNPVDEWATPIGTHPTWRRLISTHMSGGTTGGGYDLPGIGYTSIFIGTGIAIHSTYWHNNFGVPMSHGCVNARPDDANWIFRWMTPHVTYDPGDITIGMPGGTPVIVVER